MMEARVLKKAVMIGCALVATGLAAQNAEAGDRYWILPPPAVGDWSTDANWNSGEPGADDRAYISNGGTAQITAPNDEVCYDLYLGVGDSGTVDMTGGSLSVTWGNLYVGYNDDGTLNISGGGAVSNNHGKGYIGRESGSTGVVTVDGTGSTWTNGGDLLVGEGSLDITGGGAVSNDTGYIGYGSDSTGVVTVDGAGSTWTNSEDLFVGRYGNGTLNITGGGEVTVGGDTWISPYSGSTGTINFDNGTLTTGALPWAFDDLAGTGTIITHGLFTDVDLVFDATHGLSQTFTIDDNPGQNITLNLDVDGSGAMGAGYLGHGTIRISDGRVVESTRGYVGYKSGSTGAVTVEGTGSTWTNSAELYVGNGGDGTLNISGGGAVRNDDASIGYGSDSTGAVTVNGTGSTWTISGYDGHLYVGHFGDGTLNISGGGAVSCNQCFIGRGYDSTGAVTVDGAGSTWTISGHDGYLYVGYYGDSTLNITGGGVVSNDDNGYIGLEFGSTGAVTVDGTGSTWTNRDELYVGFYGDGTLNITGGGLVSVGYVLTIDKDKDGDSFINMSTGGMLALFGDADDSLGDFLGLIHGTDAIRYWNDNISDWDDITNATMGVDYQLAYLTAGNLSGYTMLTVPEPATLGLLAAGLGAIWMKKRRVTG